MPKDLESQPEGDNKTNTYLYTQSQYQALNHVVGAVFSALTPTISMVILYCIESMNVKVALVCLFTVIFCLALSTLSKARRIEIFAATAAFGSVQVVWISQTNQ
ncbi:Uu.00g004230.m01.CDS01 [Anthostomella pinea]|uniref:Uu.00g004230.m01.CDS01 n=1 Tax=Anthostomella pinea TaxID=933095 RepID=A0AAI8VEK6_9PEZI|nr:Uu.00g004230.m01.CDS01 [Anthostomella pinea]